MIWVILEVDSERRMEVEVVKFGEGENASREMKK